MDEIWLHRGESGEILGPFSITQLDQCHFRANLRIWRATEKEEDAILLMDALNGKFHNELPALKPCLKDASGLLNNKIQSSKSDLGQSSAEDGKSRQEHETINDDDDVVPVPRSSQLTVSVDFPHPSKKQKQPTSRVTFPHSPCKLGQNHDGKNLSSLSNYVASSSIGNQPGNDCSPLLPSASVPYSSPAFMQIAKYGSAGNTMDNILEEFLETRPHMQSSVPGSPTWGLVSGQNPPNSWGPVPENNAGGEFLQGNASMNFDGGLTQERYAKRDGHLAGNTSMETRPHMQSIVPGSTSWGLGLVPENNAGGGFVQGNASMDFDGGFVQGNASMKAQSHMQSFVPSSTIWGLGSGQNPQNSCGAVPENNSGGYFVQGNASMNFDGGSTQENKSGGYFVQGNASMNFDGGSTQENNSGGYFVQGNASMNFGNPAGNRNMEAQPHMQSFVPGSTPWSLESGQNPPNSWGAVLENNSGGHFVQGNASMNFDGGSTQENNSGGYFVQGNASMNFGNPAGNRNMEAQPHMQSFMPGSTPWSLESGQNPPNSWGAVPENNSGGHFVQGNASMNFDGGSTQENNSGGYFVQGNASMNFGNPAGNRNMEAQPHVQSFMPGSTPWSLESGQNPLNSWGAVPENNSGGYFLQGNASMNFDGGSSTQKSYTKRHGDPAGNTSLCKSPQQSNGDELNGHQNEIFLDGYSGQGNIGQGRLGDSLGYGGHGRSSGFQGQEEARRRISRQPVNGPCCYGESCLFLHPGA